MRSQLNSDNPPNISVKSHWKSQKIAPPQSFKTIDQHIKKNKVEKKFNRDERKTRSKLEEHSKLFLTYW